MLALFDHPGRPRLAFQEPVRLVVANRPEDVVSALSEVDAACRGGMWAAGYVAYEAGAAFDAGMPRRSGPPRLPLVAFGIYREPEAAPRDGPVSGGDAVRYTGTARSATSVRPTDTAGGPAMAPWTSTGPRETFEESVAEIRDAIGRGDVYQVNLTLRLRARPAGDDRTLYRRLLRAQGSSWGAYIRSGDHSIVSASPELFFRRDGDIVTARPMKGTRPRGRWPEEDESVRRELHESDKERAENLMIVDLVRNDLGCVARPGSVRVPRLFEVERYRTVWQMTSTIVAHVPGAVTLAELFGALFPCGSVTGAPKIAAMRAIDRLEPEPRGVYCGAIGLVMPGGDCRFSVAIRTAVLDRSTGTIEYGAGAGITWDSDPSAEYDEVVSKAAVVERDWPCTALLETMRLQNGRYHRLERHLRRLERSARYFGIPVDLVAVRGRLEEVARGEAMDEALEGMKGGPAGDARRVRLLVAEDGAVELAVEAPMRPDDAAPRPVAFASEPVSSRDPFLYHKTAHREPYERRRVPGCWDVLLVNERGHVTEFTRGNLVAELDGALWTPPRDAGLLAGTFRAELLERGRIRERPLTPADVRRASGLWFVNSVRGWVPVELVTDRSGQGPVSRILERR